MRSLPAWLCLLRAAIALKRLKLPGDEQIGVDIIRRACEEPIRQIVQNSGEEGAIVMGKIRKNKNPHFGYNARTDTFEDLVESGVIDPAKVTRSALQNAASIAGLMQTTEAMVCEIPEKRREKSGNGHPHRVAEPARAGDPEQAPQLNAPIDATNGLLAL